MLTRIEKRIVDCYRNKEEEDIGYIVKQMLIAPFPHRDPGEILVWSKKVNNLEFIINPLIRKEGDKVINYGIPYGATARVILLYMITEARRQGSKEVVIGKSFSDFLRKLDYDVTGGQKGTINRVKEQLKRIVSCSCSWVFEDNSRTVYNKRAQFVTEALLWKGEFFNKRGFGLVVFSEEFYDIIKTSCVPINYNIVRAIKHSSMALDVYFWINYVAFYNNKRRILTYETLRNQFAPENPISNFKRDFKKCLSYLRSVGLNINVVEAKNSLILFPTTISE